MTARARLAGLTRRQVAVDHLFAPYVLALALLAPVLVVYLALPTDAFEGEYFSRKWDTLQASTYALLAVGLFAAGAAAGDAMVRRPDAGPVEELPPARRARLRALCVAALVGTIGAYALWFGRGVVNAGGLGELLAAFREDPDFVRFELLRTLPGITTLTQLAVAAVPLAVAYRLVRDRLVLGLVLLVLAIAFGWSIFASQRFALIELAVPLAYLAVAGRRAPVRRVALVLALTLVAAVVFFVVAEVGRRGSYEEFALGDGLWRFGHYYLGSVNNAHAIADHDLLATPAFFVTQSVWEFPLSSRLGLTYEGVTGVAASYFVADFPRANVVSPAINTFGVIGEVAADFGWAGLLWILGIGAAAGALYRAGRRDPFFRALYAVWLVGILEFLRVYFFFSTRVVPAYLVFAVVFLFVVRGSPAASVAPAAAARGAPVAPGAGSTE